MAWKIFDPFDGGDLPDATVNIYWSKAELHGATFIADVGEDDDHFIAFQLRDGRTAKLLSYDLYQEGEATNGKEYLEWEGAGK